MTVSSIVPVNNYTGNGSSTTFDFDFLIENESELVVTHKNINAGNETVLTLGIDYSINETGNKNGSYITFPLQTSNYSILSTEEMITLSLSLPIKQESEFENSANLNLSVLEWTFDYIVRILQILTRKVERSVKVQEGETTTPDELVNNLYTARSDAQSAAQNAITEAQKAANSALEAKNASLVLNTKANVDMDNITTAGINNIKEIIEVSSAMPIGTIYPLVCSANYVPEGSLPCDGAEYTKAQFNDLWENYLTATTPLLLTCTYEEYASDITTYGQCGKFAVKPLAFDSSKITIVGTPTISEDGVVSDFSTSNYVKTSINIDGSITKIREKFHISTFENTTISELYRSNCFVLMIGTGSNYNLRARVGNAAENNWLMVNYTILPNKDYIGECVINKTTKLATLNLYDENNNLLGTYTNSTPFVSITLTDEDNTVTIGYGNNRAFTNGTIDLTQFSITVDGDEVYNCVSGNTFKVPTIKDGAYITQAKSDTELGKSYNESLPNLKGSYDSIIAKNPIAPSGTFSGSVSSGTTRKYSLGESYAFDIGNILDFNAANSSSTYQDNAKVQGDNVRMRYFVVVATGSVNESQMNWSEWTSSLQGKANTDLNNLSNNGKKVIDGQWISSPHLLSSAIATGTYTIDLSSYLPNDNYTYEVILNIKTYHTGNCNVTVYTSDFPPFEFSSKTYTSDIGQYARSQANTFILPVSQKQVLMKIGTANASENYLSMIAYRRVGTNV